MIRVRRLAELIVLAILATGASAKAQPESDRISPVQGGRISEPDQRVLEHRDPTIPGQSTPFASKPVDEARRDAASMNFTGFSGGPTGALLAGAALLTAAAIILAGLVRW